ncbi:MAG: 50S ribosomal protein L10 [Candidatus Fermentibacteraceae bacterium]|nr:50S ribosomal protein L10 [Candidatus Fermentibacteraceae bacterium]MBN2609753.1 50S ribosomal protein L10 [Candidatus Fermentibacteraceae bacterium]
MAVSRKQKEKVVATLIGDLGEARSVILADFTGINVADMTDLRVQMRENGITFTVVKNTLLRKIFKEIEIGKEQDVYSMMEGPTALAYSSDEVMPIKVIKKFAEDHDGLPQVKGGLVSGVTYEVGKLMKLADIPSRDELLAKFMGSALSPLQGFVSVSSGIIRKFFYALNAVRESKEN